MSLPIELWIKIALSAPCGLLCVRLRMDTDEHMFNSLARAIPYLGRWTIGAHHDPLVADNKRAMERAIVSSIINRRLDLMIMFGYSVHFETINESTGRMDMYDNFTKKDPEYIIWRKNGIIHRNDQPALQCVWNYKDTECGWILEYRWMYHGLPHNTRGVAVVTVCCDPCYTWYQRGTIHRTDGPAVLDGEYSVVWYKHGIYHRDDGPADIDIEGAISWFLENRRHRSNGPSYISPSGELRWYVNDEPTTPT